MSTNRLLPVLAVAFLGGALVCEPFAGAAVLALSLAPGLKNFRPAAMALLAGTLLGAPGQFAPLPEEDLLVRVCGRVESGPDLPSGGRSHLDLELERIGDRPVRGTVRAYLPDDSPLPSPGATVDATGRIVRPRSAANPGERDGRRSLESRGIGHLLLVRSRGAIKVITPAPLHSAFIHRARMRMDRAISGLHDRDTAEVLSCLLLGRRDRLPDEVVDDFRRTGTLHFLAISGLHVGILAGALWLFLRPFSRRAAGVLIAVAVVLYAGISGFRPPVFRACVLVVLASIGIAVRRRPRPLHLLAAGAVLILLDDPGAAGRPGFILSFTAVLSILHLAPPLTQGLFERYLLMDKFSVPRKSPTRFLRTYVMRGVPVSLGAWLGTAPIVLREFGTLSLLVIPANLIVMPFIALLLPAGLIAAATGIEFPARLLTHGLLRVESALASIPMGSVVLPPPPLVLLVPYYALLYAAGRRPRLTPFAAGGLLLALGAVAAAGPLMRQSPDEPRVTALSVGAGLAVVVETPEGGVAIYDVGSRRPRIFARTVLPFLRHRRISRIDLLVLSHDDTDHVSGARALLSSLPVARVIRPGDVREGDRLSVPGAEFDVLWPPAGVEAEGNDASTVLLLRVGDLRVLLSGDLEEAGVRGLTASGGDLSAEVLLLPHHGRPCGEARRLLEAVGPRLLLSSDERDSPLDPAYVGSVRTSERGAITVTPGPRIATFR